MRAAGEDGCGYPPNRPYAYRLRKVRLALLLRRCRRRDDAVMVGASVLVVDDHAGFRETVHQLLELEGYTVVGEAADGHSALVLARKLQPEIALIDVHLPDMDGFELTARLQSLASPPLVILTSSRDSVDFMPFVSESGARGFVPKAELSREAIEGALP